MIYIFVSIDLGHGALLFVHVLILSKIVRASFSGFRDSGRFSSLLNMVAGLATEYVFFVFFFSHALYQSQKGSHFWC